MSLGADNDQDSFDGVARVGGAAFRIVTVPLVIDDVSIGTLYLATILDQAYAEELAKLAGAKGCDHQRRPAA